MFHLYFIRSTQTWATSTYYEKHTDVWIFGDIDGYSYLIRCLLDAKAGRHRVKVVELNFSSNTMQVEVLAPAVLNTKEPRLKFTERLISGLSCPSMQLIIYGNSEGYEYLIAKLKAQSSEEKDDVSRHIHLDSLDDSIVQRSVSLNIRRALGVWNREPLGAYESMIFDSADRLLPENAEMASWEETEVDPGEDPLYKLE